MVVPENVRVLIVWHVVHHNMPCADATRLFGCDASSVYTFKETYLAIADLWPNGSRRNTHYDNTLYDDVLKTAIIEIIEERPEIFVREVDDILRALQQLPGWPGQLTSSASTIDRVLRAVGCTHKRVITHYKERNDYLRVRWARRRSGRAPLGQRSHRLLGSPRNRPRFTVTVGISSTGGVLTEYIIEHADGGSGQTEYD